ncbi:unnamed protein product [Scytosiphon promiscuus]
MAAGSVVLGSATFLIAVSGLLAPPLNPPRRCSPQFPHAFIPAPRVSRRGFPKERASNRAVSKAPPAHDTNRRIRMAHEAGRGRGIEADPDRGRGGSLGFESPDAGAWKSIPSSPQGAAAPTAVPVSLDPTAAPAARKTSSPHRRTEYSKEDATAAGECDMDVDVEKLPTFVFYGRGADGKLWREDVVGGGDARSCAAELREKFASLSSGGTAGSRPSSSSLMAPSGTGVGGAAVAGGSSGSTGKDGGRRAKHEVGRDCMVEAGTASATGSSTGDITIGNSRNSFEEISSKEDLLDVIGSQESEQGLVVVMYHARWCRKCAYLTPVFRRLASSGTEPRAVDGRTSVARGNEEISTNRSIFLRVDVSDASWGRRRVANPDESRESRGLGGHLAALSAEASGAVSDGVAAAPAIPAEGRTAAGAATTTETDLLSLHAGSPAVEDCEECGRSGFVPCGECEGRGAVVRSSPDGKHSVAVTCPACVGYKRLRCPACGGKCYMCE